MSAILLPRCVQCEESAATLRSLIRSELHREARGKTVRASVIAAAKAEHKARLVTCEHPGLRSERVAA